MKNNFIVLLTFLCCLIANLSHGQIIKGTGIVYTNGVPLHTPRTSTESEYAVDVSTGKGDLYLWNRSNNTWKLIPEGIEIVDNALVPSGAPAYGQSRFRVNNVPVLYFWTGVTWIPLTGNAYTAGTGINITGNVITNTGDLSNTNEIQYIDTLRLTGSTLEISLFNDALPLKSVSLGSLATNIYTSNGTITNQNRIVTIPGNLFFANNTAGLGENFSVNYDNGVSSSNVFKVQEGQGISLISSENGIFFEGATSFRDVLATSTLTGNTNNYAGLEGGNVGILSSNGEYNITGIDGGFNGRILFLFNNGNFDLTLTNQDVLSDIENRFYMGSDYILKADTGSAIIMYDTLIPGWRLFKFFTASSGSSVNIYNSDGTIAGPRNVEVDGILNFNDADADAEVNITANSLTLATAIENINIITPTALSANTDNWNPTGLTTAYEIRVSSTGKFNLTGIIAQNNGREILLRNVGNHPITLKDNVTSTAANRFSIGADYNLRPNNHAVKIVYDDNVDRWIVEGGLSLGTGSGRIAGGRNQNVLWSYQTDTLMDFGIGYLPIFPSDPTGTSYGGFGIGIDGDLGFEIQGKETFILGTSFDLLKSSNVNAGADSYQLESRNRTTVGGVSNSSYLYGTPSANQWVLLQSHDLYQLLDIGSKKVLTGVPQTKTDYNYIFQGGGETGSDTSGISMWLGQPQYTDTTNSMGNGVRAVSKERGWGVQSLYNSIIGARSTNTFDWIKITTGVVPSDTTADAIRFYGNKWEIPNQTPSSSAGDSSVIVWTSPFNSFFIDIDDIKGGSGSGVNIYNSDGTQDDADRLFTQDSSRTFAMGQFTSVSTPTWGRGYYYDPSTSNGIRLLNKNGANTTTAMVELDPETVNLITTHTTATSTVSQLTLSESSAWSSTIDRTTDTYGSLILGSATNTNEEIIGLKQNGKADIPGISMYLGDGYASSQYGLYANRAWGVQTHVNGGFDWIQVLFPNTATDTTGNNLSFYNRKYYWSNESPSFTNLDTMVHVWIGNGTNATPDFVNINDLFNSSNIYNSNGTTTQNTRNVTITETLNFIGTASAGVDPYPFQVKVTGTEPYIQLWKGNSDSAYIYQSDAEYVFGSSSHLVIQSDDYVVIQGDSIQAQTIAAKTKIRGILGISSVGTIHQFNGDDASSGDILASDGTDWIVTTPAALGYVLQNGNLFSAGMTIGTNDNNVLNFETNNTTGLTLGTDQHLTATSIVAATNSNTNRLIVQTNSSGTPAAGFGSGLLLRGKSNTTDNRDMLELSTAWISSTDASRTSNFIVKTAINGTMSEVVRFFGNSVPQMTIGNSGASYFATSINAGSGNFSITSSSTASSTAISLGVTGNNTAASGSLGGGTFTTTSGTKYDWRVNSVYAPTSGTGLFYNMRFDGTINQTGGANGATGAIIFEPTLTAIGSKWSAISSAISNSNALFLNQTGANSYSTHVGAVGFGSATVPTDKVEVTGNVALLTAGNKLKIATGSNASVGTSGAMTAGSITISTTAVTANSQIFLTHATVGGTQGILSVGTVTAGTSFVINSSSASDTGSVHWIIIN